MITNTLRSSGHILLIVSSLLLTPFASHASYLNHDEARKFIDEIAVKHKFNRAELKGIFKQIERQDKVIEAMSRPAERVLQWKDYRPIFVTDKRIKAGVKFWREHQAIISKAEQEYGIPAEIIVAIIGVETFFGRYKGKHPALASLATLAFDYPPRSKFFRSELEHFLLLSKEEGLDPLSIKGSYAAAMGMPQFISSSYREYAIDFDSDGRRDLWTNIADVTGSVANYFSRHGWKQGQPIAEQVTPQGSQYKKLISKKLKPTISDEQLLAAKVLLSRPSEGKKSLHKLVGPKGDELWVGHNNFYVITRYNHSKLYAMAVFQLSQRLAAGLSNNVLIGVRPAAVVILAVTVSACSFLSSDEDGPGEQISANSVLDAVPKRVTKSKYGNPKSYVVNGKRYIVKTTSRGYVARGTASWYGKKFHGRRTSSGEVFNMYRATAAHRSLPLPTYATVTNLDNGKQVIVKINDRGPFHSERIIDLSYGAAVKIGIAATGTGRVEVRVIDGAEPLEPQAASAETRPLVTNGTYVQVGAFKHFVNAQEMRARAQGAGLLGVSVDPTKNSRGEELFRVRVGPFSNTAKIDATVAKLRAAGINDFKLVSD